MTRFHRFLNGLIYYVSYLGTSWFLPTILYSTNNIYRPSWFHQPPSITHILVIGRVDFHQPPIGSDLVFLNRRWGADLGLTWALLTGSCIWVWGCMYVCMYVLGVW